MTVSQRTRHLNRNEVLQRSTYTVKGISHHDVAERLGVWLPECVGKMVTLGVESAEENEIGVECVAVYDVDEHLCNIDDNDIGAKD